MRSEDIRRSFLDFFRSKGHEILPSAPIVVKNDPTLMFTNAGMNQFKDYFLGNRVSPHARVANTQKCLRVSGKHNDLEEVGVDTYHHTMFEMLGNWSFGDYFKNEAIEWSWELLTSVYKIPKEKIYVTVFGGDEKEKTPRDKEAVDAWKKYIDEDRILFFGKKDNFWEMGDTGPCGPCTEIHVDCRPDEERKRVDGKTLVNNDHPQVIEIWNNVFIQYNRLRDGSLELLPAKHVDTGMGFERLVRVLQNKQSNYDTDVFSGMIAEIGRLTEKSYDRTESKEAVAFRVIADHIRAISFTIADGQLPSNTGSGYVIRRILRRAVRYYFSYLGYKQPLLHSLVNTLAAQFLDVFPELEKQSGFVARVIREEEEGFLRTLDKGLKRIDDLISSSTIKKIGGKEAFELYDTYGFPFDLTQLIAAENSFEVDEKGFDEEMKQQKDRSRAATQVDTGDWTVLSEGSNRFVGYDQLESHTRLLKYRKVKAKGSEAFQLVLENTPFYAESGGQVGDRGELLFNGVSIPVYNTKKDNDLIIHFAESLPETPGNEVIAKVDPLKRKNTALHHSATHLLHAALRRVLGSHVAQKGSLVNEEHLRFDFSHFAKMSAAEMAEVESLVNLKIRENIPVVIKEMPKEEAMQLGAMALFGEKYGDIVRVVVIDPAYSVELCGGTHVGATGELGFFKITSESAIAAGVRRVEAICGSEAENFIHQQLNIISELREILKNPADLLKAVEALQSGNADLKKHLESMEARQLVGIRNELIQKDEIINGVNFIGDIVEVSNADALKKLCFDLKNHIRDHVAILCVNIGGKPYVALGISETVVKAKSLDAGKIIKEKIAPLIKGGGGGQKTLATASGQDAGKLGEVIQVVRSLL
jgi:alanyl-tRNA synthetase